MRFLVLVSLVFAVLLAAYVQADIYMHNPRGGNNKLDEANNNRENANRLFDSQNNDNGGYNVGGLYYYVGSILYVEYTAQHGNNISNLDNEIILQYSCADSMPGLRDGNSRTTIPDNVDTAKKIEYGQHETYTYYQKCKSRLRNQRLYWADQTPRGNGAIYTRQNPNGNRYGFECPEERDYYPYWAPTPWRDLAVFTTKPSRCDFYQTESENVKGRFECTGPNGRDNSTFFQYINETLCTRAGGYWTQRQPHGLPPPSCGLPCTSRDNHLGNSDGGYPCYINVTIPDTPSSKCVLRIRYNVSTGDFDGWGVTSENNTNGKAAYPVSVYYPSGSGSVKLTDNPQVDIGIGVKLQIALNSDQTFRTFQDRSHSFSIRERNSESGGGTIHNLNVRGRRGNIVQVYPSVEYDFVPNKLLVQTGESVHFQWTGSNTNPAGNDGEGQAQSDRSNFVEIKNLAMNFPISGNFTFFSPADAKRFALLNKPQNGGETQTLDDAGTYFDGGVMQMNRVGEWYFASTRNNNFSNRSQKMTLSVVPFQLTPGVTAGVVVGSVLGGSAVIAGIAGISYYAFKLTAVAPGAIA